MKFKKSIVLSLAALSIMSVGPSAFATKITKDKSGHTTFDTSNNGSGSSKDQPTKVSCDSKCDFTIK